MSSLGSVIASGIAPATQQASQLASRRDKRLREQQRAAQRTQDIFEAHLETLEENDETETNARLRPDAEMRTAEHPSDASAYELARVIRRRRSDRGATLYEATGRADAHFNQGDDGQPHLDVEG